jgi:CheY-like chemotaxis protein
MLGHATRGPGSGALIGMRASEGDGRKTHAGERVLLVDDNADVRASAAELLRSLEYDVRTTGDASGAIELAAAWRPRHVLIDLHMPILNGFELARLLRERLPDRDLRLVLMSGVSLTTALVESARSAGFDECVDKLAEPEDWVKALRVK